jgi:hypothetical protein
MRVTEGPGVVPEPIYIDSTATRSTEGALHGIGGLVAQVALTDHELGLAKRVANEHVFVAWGGGSGAFSLAPPINRLRDDDRADRSPSESPSSVVSLHLLDQDLF